MKCDLHVHAILAKNIPFEINSLLRMISNATKEGLQGFALVDHIHYAGYWRTASRIKEEFPYKSGFWQVNDSFHIISGAEVNVQGDGHVLLLGDLDELHAIDEELLLSQGYQPSLEALLGSLSTGMITIGAHPFRPGCGLVQYKPSQIKALNALEVNGSDYENAGNVRGFTKVIGMPVVGGSDAHYWPMVGASHTVFPDTAADLSGLKASIAAGLTRAFIKPDAPFRVDLCNRFKRKLNSLFDTPFNNQFEREYVLS